MVVDLPFFEVAAECGVLASLQVGPAGIGGPELYF